MASAGTPITTLPRQATAYTGAPVCAPPPRGVLERQQRQKLSAKAIKTAKKRVAACSTKQQQTQVFEEKKAKEQQQIGHVRTPSSAVKAGEISEEGSRPSKISRAGAVMVTETAKRSRITTKHKKDEGSLFTGGDDGNGSSGADGDDKTSAKRLKNREHSRRSRERKKARMESLSDMAEVLGPLRVLVEQAWDMFSVHSPDVNAVFLFASTGFDRLLGIDPTSLVGRSLLDLVHPKDAPAVASAIMKILDLEGGIKQVRYQMRPLPGTGA
ncbi:unnamed protein product, partial [Scytosiphon promiscuus]